MTLLASREAVSLLVKVLRQTRSSVASKSPHRSSLTLKRSLLGMPQVSLLSLRDRLSISTLPMEQVTMPKSNPRSKSQSSSQSHLQAAISSAPSLVDAVMRLRQVVSLQISNPLHQTTSMSAEANVSRLLSLTAPMPFVNYHCWRQLSQLTITRFRRVALLKEKCSQRTRSLPI